MLHWSLLPPVWIFGFLFLSLICVMCAVVTHCAHQNWFMVNGPPDCMTCAHCCGQNIMVAIWNSLSWTISIFGMIRAPILLLILHMVIINVIRSHGDATWWSHVHDCSLSLSHSRTHTHITTWTPPEYQICMNVINITLFYMGQKWKWCIKQYDVASWWFSVLCRSLSLMNGDGWVVFGAYIVYDGAEGEMRYTFQIAISILHWGRTHSAHYYCTGFGQEKGFPH